MPTMVGKCIFAIPPITSVVIGGYRRSWYLCIVLTIYIDIVYIG